MWSEDVRNIAQALEAFGFLALVVVYLAIIMRFLRGAGGKKKGRNTGGGMFEDLFMSRKKRVESRYLVYRGKNYPRKTVRARVQRFLPELKKHRWGK